MRMQVKVRRDDSGRFVASSPSLPGCVSKADTAQQAVEQFIEVSRGYLAAVNNFVPERIIPQQIQRELICA